MEDRSLPQEEWDRPLGQSSEPLPQLPDREWLQAICVDVDYRVATMNGQTQYVKDQEGNLILDQQGNSIPRKEFNFTFEVEGYTLPNGKPRRAWVSMGASMGKKAHLPVFLENIGLVDQVDLTPTIIKDYAVGKRVKIQMANYKNAAGEPRQKCVWDSVKLTD